MKTPIRPMRQPLRQLAMSGDRVIDDVDALMSPLTSGRLNHPRPGTRIGSRQLVG